MAKDGTDELLGLTYTEFVANVGKVTLAPNHPSGLLPGDSRELYGFTNTKPAAIHPLDLNEITRLEHGADNLYESIAEATALHALMRISEQLRADMATVSNMLAKMEEEKGTIAGSANLFNNNSTEAVKARVEHVIDDLVAGRTTPDQRRGLGTAVERAGRVDPKMDAGLDHAIKNTQDHAKGFERGIGFS